MRPLLFVNWSSVNGMFRALMWIAVIVLVGVIAVHFMAATPPAHHSAQMLR